MSRREMTGHGEGADGLPRSVVVVGASHAAVQLADRLRLGGYTGPLTLIGDETHPPYHRPPLSKAWLKGESTPDQLVLRAAEHYSDNEIEMLLGTTVQRVERDGDGVALHLQRSDGSVETRTFDRLVLATGARARRSDIPGSDHPDVLVLRELDHAQRLADRVAAGPVVVIGGGFVGLEVAATLRGLDVAVTVVEAGRQLMGRAVGPGTAEFLLAAHREMGVDVILDAKPVEIALDGDRVRAVRLDDGREIAAATVLVGIGAEPRTELAEQLGLACDRGIVVDERCATSDGHILAIGDCTVQETGGGARVRLESVDSAGTQADTAAATLLGREVPVRPVPWFWSDQGSWKIQIAGRIDGHTEVVVRTDPSKPRRRVTLYFEDDQLLAAECVNAPADFVALRSALARGYRPSRELFADETVPLKKLLGAVRSS
ncbi:NAD(P)/FAD-dependent oxidoreductase [Rhodococcus pyridinivorans]|uniref:NAD(P)/FAD-dependent oxidoreductase n=1 Tax=Rhodococcus pyridinivorans TaxID=103816 RepID=UPI0020C76058|nr:FAD-dependent oxidoreductase [Rhodococcus pyridinivorans]